MDDSSVHVVVRIRPRHAREVIDGCQICTTVTPDQPQIWMGGNQGFTFDQVHDINSSQEQVFSTVEKLVDGCLEGYNATILAYGQTGSGKTYSMGTGFETEQTTHGVTPEHGIIPRAVHRLFEQIKRTRDAAIDRNEQPPTFTVTAQFVELHNEEINDLISPETPTLLLALNPMVRVPSKMENFLGSPSMVFRQTNKPIKIHEDIGGGIYIVGVESTNVSSVPDAMKCLREGALIRSTASTNMNDTSSRSHAIFTLHVRRQKFVKNDCDGESSGEPEMETLSAKFHFVDLAGSERLKRTGAVGERAKEGISINCGLLALGNVISALGDKAKKALHVPYRDSKLTRLLQDSLGGNSRTIMIACVSPCDRDFVETLNTLKYANRARNIKNKVTINQDKSSRIISNLKQEIARLEAELHSYKQGKVTSANGEEIQTDLYHENVMLSNELEKFRTRVKALQETVERLTASNAALLAERACGSLVTSTGGEDYTVLVQKYTVDIEELRSKLYESEATCDVLRRKQSTTSALLNQSLSPRPHSLMASRPGTAYNENMERSAVQSQSTSNIIATAQAEIREHELRKRKLTKKLKKRRLRRSGSGTNGILPTENGNDTEESLESSEGDGEEEDTEQLEPYQVENIEEEIAGLVDCIDTKQDLIDQLELSTRRAVETKEQYEKQIEMLVTKIKHTEEERDTVLTSLKPTAATSAKVKQVKEEFEAKLAVQTKDLNRMKAALKEHNNLIKRNAATEKQVETLKADVDVMKRLKVKLQNQLRDENVKFRENDARRQKEILQLKKEHRKKEVEIRTLQSKEKLKDQIIKRKLDEVSALKRQNKSALSRRAAGRLPTAPVHKRLSPAKAKKKWAELQSVFEKRASDRRQMEQMELEMLTHIQSRKKALEEIDQLDVQIASGNLSEEEINRFNDDIDTLKASIQYSDEQISQNQRDICELTSGSPKTEEQIPDISLAMDHFSKEDCEYLMQKMYEFTMENVGEYKEAASNLSLAQEQVSNLTMELVTANELLNHVFGKYCAGDPNLSPDLSVKINKVRTANRCRTAVIKRNGQAPILPPPPPPSEPETGGESLANVQSQVKNEAVAQNGNGSYPLSPSSVRRFVRRQIPVGDDMSMSRKARRLTSSRKELMGDMHQVIAPVLDDGFVRPGSVDSRSGPLMRTSSLRLPNNRTRIERRETFVIHEQTPTTDSLNNVTGPPAKPNSAGRKTSLMSKAYRAPSSAPSNGIAGSNSEFSRVPTDHFNADTTFIVETTSPGTVSAPGSPGTTRKVLNENVFQRLTSTTSGTNIEQNTQQGSIRSIREKLSQKSPFQLTHIANGHSKAVLDICVTEGRLFTSGKDSAVKLWDLKEMREIRSITMPALVTRVKFDEASQLLFCASGCYVRIYDIRKNQCINTLSSAGICSSVDPPPESYVQFPTKEQQIAAIAFTPESSSLYTSYGQMVRLWDMRSFTSLGIITGKHQSSVMCMESQSGANGSSILVTGSKDHCIKVYTYASDEPFMNISMPPKATLSPPHYDGIECFALSGSTLFSGSRDCCIKKWDLSVKEDHHTLAYAGAHNSWITGLCLPSSHPQYLVSASRDGTMKVWNKDNSRSVGQVEAHKGGVNCLTSNKTAIFTGSNVGQVKFWRLNETNTLSSSCMFSPQKRPIPNRLLPLARRRNDEDIMTMSTGRAYGLSI